MSKEIAEHNNNRPFTGHNVKLVLLAQFVAVC